MERRASDHVMEQPDTEMNMETEVVEATPSTAYIDIEIDLNHLKQKPGLIRFVKSEPALLVKEESLEDSGQDGNEQQCVQGTSTPASTGSGNEACATSLGDLLNVKHEQTDIDTGPTVLQPMDSYYTINQNTSDVTEANAMVYDCNQPMPCNIIKEESFEDNLRDSSSKPVHGSEDHKHQRYSCDKCLKVYRYKRHLYLHDTRDHGTESHKCIQCNKEFKCKLYLERHVRYTHSTEQYECDICKKMCKSREALYRHVSRFHRIKPAGKQHQRYRCDKCLKAFNSKCLLNRHCKNIHGAESLKCTQCNKEFKCKSYLVRHVRYIHNKVKYECDICKKVCSTPGVLRYHVRYIHSKEKYKCDICKKTYSTPGVLRLHVLKIHHNRSTGTDDNYTCDHCQQTFRKKLIMQQHIEVIHGERIPRCRKCNKTFKRRSHLQRHKTVIHGKLQHECEVCHRFFTTRNILNAHVKKYHGLGDTQVKSDLCSQEVYISYSIAGDTGAVASTGTQQCSAGDVKPEVADAELELGPVVFQHMDANYRPHKEEPQLD